MKKRIEKEMYKISRIVATLLVFIVFLIYFSQLDESLLYFPFIFGLIALGISFPGTIASKKFIKIGNKIKDKFSRVLYYLIGLPLVLSLVYFVIFMLVNCIYDYIPSPNDIGHSIGNALLFLFSLIVISLCLIIPYVQTLIVLVLNLNKKKK